MTEITLADGPTSIIIDIEGYEHLHPQTKEDASWLRCRISVKTIYFLGAVTGSLRINDFSEFQFKLRNRLNGDAKPIIFKDLEGWLELHLEFTRSNHCQANCTVGSHAKSKDKFTFLMELDSTIALYLPQAIQGVLTEFPHRKI